MCQVKVTDRESNKTGRLARKAIWIRKQQNELRRWELQTEPRVEQTTFILTSEAEVNPDEVCRSATETLTFCIKDLITGSLADLGFLEGVNLGT